MDNQQKDKTLELAIGQIEKEFGKGAIMRMGDGTKVKIGAISMWSTASFTRNVF